MLKTFLCFFVSKTEITLSKKFVMFCSDIAVMLCIKQIIRLKYCVISIYVHPNLQIFATEIEVITPPLYAQFLHIVFTEICLSLSNVERVCKCVLVR